MDVWRRRRVRDYGPIPDLSRSFTPQRGRDTPPTPALRDDHVLDSRDLLPQPFERLVSWLYAVGAPSVRDSNDGPLDDVPGPLDDHPEEHGLVVAQGYVLVVHDGQLPLDVDAQFV